MLIENNTESLSKFEGIQRLQIVQSSPNQFKTESITNDEGRHSKVTVDLAFQALNIDPSGLNRDERDFLEKVDLLSILEGHRAFR